MSVARVVSQRVEGTRAAEPPTILNGGANRAHLDELVHEFLRYLASYRRASPLTTDAYGRDLKRLMHFLQAQGQPLTSDSLEPRNLEAFAVSLSGYAPATINRALNAISSFCSFLVRTGRLDRNAVDGVLKPKKQRNLPDIPGLDDCRALIASAADRRERAMALLLVGAGLRRAELLDLRVSDLSADLCQLTVCGKGSKQRLIFLPEEATAALADYLPTRTAGSDWLFVNKAGARIGNTTFCRMFRRLKRRAGLGDRDLTPHRLRHFYATQLLRSAVDVKTVQELLGHSDISVTSLYLHSGDSAKKAAAAALPSFVTSAAGEGVSA